MFVSQGRGKKKKKKKRQEAISRGNWHTTNMEQKKNTKKHLMSSVDNFLTEEPCLKEDNTLWALRGSDHVRALYEIILVREMEYNLTLILPSVNVYHGTR